LNLRLKKLVDKNLLKIYSFGSSFGYNFLSYNQGVSVKNFLNFLEGKSILSTLLIKSPKNLFIFNWSFFNKLKNNFDFFLYRNKHLFFLENKLQYSVLSYDSTSLLINDFNLSNSVNSFDDESFKLINASSALKDNLFFLLNTDNFNFFFKDYSFFKQNNVIYQGMYNANDSLKKIGNFFLPSANFIEKNATYINFFGLIQKVKFILFSFKNVRSDFKILYILFKDFLLNFGNNFSKSFNLQKIFAKYNFLDFNLFIPKMSFSYFSNFFYFNNILCSTIITNFYKTNSILRRSQILSVCYRDIKKIYSNFS